MKRVVILLMLALTTGSCQFSREVRVVWRNGKPAIDFPWSFWRVLGLQDREYPCIDSVEMFDAKGLLWSLDAAKPDGDCTDAAMPIIIGEPKEGFLAKGSPRLAPGRYGIRIDSYADARVDFVLHPDGTLRSITEWDKLMKAPCGTRWGVSNCPEENPSRE